MLVNRASAGLIQPVLKNAFAGLVGFLAVGLLTLPWRVKGNFMELGAWIVIFLAIIFYLLPCVISASRGCKHGGMIFMINLLFGWTILGWIAALIWAIVEAPEAEPLAAIAPATPAPSGESGFLPGK
jgi:hypothetical protein